MPAAKPALTPEVLRGPYITRCRAGFGVVVTNGHGVEQIVAIYALRAEAKAHVTLAKAA